MLLSRLVWFFSLSRSLPARARLKDGARLVRQPELVYKALPDRRHAFSDIVATLILAVVLLAAFVAWEHALVHSHRFSRPALLRLDIFKRGRLVSSSSQCTIRIVPTPDCCLLVQAVILIVGFFGWCSFQPILVHATLVRVARPLSLDDPSSLERTRPRPPAFPRISGPLSDSDNDQVPPDRRMWHPLQHRLRPRCALRPRLDASKLWSCGYRCETLYISQKSTEISARLTAFFP